MADWFAEPANWVFLVLGLIVAVTGIRVVSSQNVVHAALYLVASLAATAGLFLLLSAEFVAWVLVLVYIGAVIVLFLFGIMITRAPTGYEAGLDHPRKLPAALIAVALFILMSATTVAAFEDSALQGIGEGTSTETIGRALLNQYVLPFEVVSIVLLAALIGGITIARKDESPAEEGEA